jgi:hypothetical protein
LSKRIQDFHSQFFVARVCMCRTLMHSSSVAGRATLLRLTRLPFWLRREEMHSPALSRIRIVVVLVMPVPPAILVHRLAVRRTSLVKLKVYFSLGDTSRVCLCVCAGKCVNRYRPIRKVHRLHSARESPRVASLHFHVTLVHSLFLQSLQTFQLHNGISPNDYLPQILSRFALDIFQYHVQKSIVASQRADDFAVAVDGNLQALVLYIMNRNAQRNRGSISR